MAKFLYLYRGPATPQDEMTEEQSKAVMEHWNTWMEEVGHAVSDIGSPLDSAGVSIVDDGSHEDAPQLNGYTIMEANDMEAAQAMAEKHPFLVDKSGKFCIDIYEIQPLPDMAP